MITNYNMYMLARIFAPARIILRQTKIGGAHGPMGPWAHGPMGPMGPWAHYIILTLYYMNIILYYITYIIR